MTPSISFMESAPEVALCPGDEGVIGLARELASTLGHMDEEKGDEDVEVSCADLRSTLSAEDSM